MRLTPVTSSPSVPAATPPREVAISASASLAPPASFVSASSVTGSSTTHDDVATTARTARLARLIGARVPGGIDFSGVRPEPRGPALPLYRHPADANAAATRLAAPSMLDVTA